MVNLVTTDTDHLVPIAIFGGFKFGDFVPNAKLCQITNLTKFFRYMIIIAAPLLIKENCQNWMFSHLPPIYARILSNHPSI